MLVTKDLKKSNYLSEKQFITSLPKLIELNNQSSPLTLKISSSLVFFTYKILIRMTFYFIARDL